MLPSSFPSPLGPAKIYLYAKPADMRKSFNGLHAIVQSEFRRDIRSGRALPNLAGSKGLDMRCTLRVARRATVTHKPRDLAP